MEHYTMENLAHLSPTIPELLMELAIISLNIMAIGAQLMVMISFGQLF
jgi:hypothetical protein